MMPATRSRPPDRPLRPIRRDEIEVLNGWLTQIMDAQPAERPMLAIRARADFKGWPCIVCTTCTARRRAESPSSAYPHRLTISGVIDHYRRAFGYVHEFTIDPTTIRVVR